MKVLAVSSQCLLILMFLLINGQSSLQDENRRTENREWKGVEYRVHFFDYERNDQKYVIWGVTATILIRVASLILEKSPSFEYLGIM